MKRLIAVLLAMTMLLALCACGAKEEEIKGAIISSEEQQEPEAPAQAEEPEAPAEEVQLETGSIEGGRYENSYLGIACQLDENWSYFDQAQLAELIGVTADMFDDDSYAEQIKEADVFYDMYAAANDGSATINVVIQNMGLLFGTVMTEKEFLDASLGELETQLNSAGFENVKVERATIQFAGAEHEGLRIESQVQGINYYCTQILIKQGNYIATISLGSFVYDITDTLAGYFSAA